MNTEIIEDQLFGNTENAFVLFEYRKELDLLKDFIEYAEDAVECSKTESMDSSEGICYAFAKSIIGYAKMIYDNILIGHFDSARMIIRAMIENNVHLDILFNNPEEELWKYYLVYSYRHSLIRIKKEAPEKIEKCIRNLYSFYKIPEEFYEKRDKGKAYIDLPYGWSYKINKQFNFRGLCEFVDAREYNDFSFMSDYSHGTAFHQKLVGSIFHENMMTLFSCIYAGIYKLVTLYCNDCVDDRFYGIAEDLQNDILPKIE